MDPPNQSPRFSQTFTSQQTASPSLLPAADWETDNEIDSQHDNALRSSDPNVALAWAEKVYMVVSIALEEFRREKEITGADAGVTPRLSTPSYESNLRKDCITIVEKFANSGHPKAVYILW
jgi:hypothetical protein